MTNLIDRLREDAEDHKETALLCDCRPEDTVNWGHAKTCLDAIEEINRLRSIIYRHGTQDAVDAMLEFDG